LGPSIAIGQIDNLFHSSSMQGLQWLSSVLEPVHVKVDPHCVVCIWRDVFVTGPFGVFEISISFLHLPVPNAMPKNRL
jgi:hypothetical protein